MIRALLLALAIVALSVATRAQPAAQQPPSASAAFAGKLAELLTDTIAERDTARTALAACQAKQPPAQPQDAPKP